MKLANTFSASNEKETSLHGVWTHLDLVSANCLTNLVFFICCIVVTTDDGQGDNLFTRFFPRCTCWWQLSSCLQFSDFFTYKPQSGKFAALFLRFLQSTFMFMCSGLICPPKGGARGEGGMVKPFRGDVQQVRHHKDTVKISVTISYSPRVYPNPIFFVWNQLRNGWPMTPLETPPPLDIRHHIQAVCYLSNIKKWSLQSLIRWQ